MQKFILSVCTALIIFLPGCIETTQEITLNEDGSGTVTNINDLSAVIGLARQMGASEQLEKGELQNPFDSTISLDKGADSIPDLTPEEREMARTGVLHIRANMKEDKFMTDLSFRFSSLSQIAAYNKLSGKIMASVMKDKMDESAAPVPEGEMPETSSFDDYYTLEFSNGELTKKVNKEKYAGVESDEYLKAIKQTAAMGLAMKANYVINLPRPATKAEGKNVKLSEDKKKVTISADIEDFFADPSALEFKIKY